MKSTALIAVVLAALITTPAVSVPADPVDGEPVVEASAPVAASASAVPIADAAGTADAEAQGVYEAVLRARLAAGRVTVAACDAAPRTLVGTVSVTEVAAVISDESNLAMYLDPAVLVASRRVDADGVGWVDLAVYAVDDPAAVTTVVGSVVAATPDPGATADPGTHGVPGGTEVPGATAAPAPTDPATTPGRVQPVGPEADPAGPAPSRPAGPVDVEVVPADPGMEIRVVPDLAAQEEPPVVDVSAAEAADTIPELTPTTITTLTDGSEVITRSWTTPEGEKVTQIISKPAPAPAADTIPELTPTTAPAPVPTRTPTAAPASTSSISPTGSDGSAVRSSAAAGAASAGRTSGGASPAVAVVGLAAVVIAVLGGAALALSRRWGGFE